MTTAYVAFGANLGQPAETYESATEALRQAAGIGMVRASRLYRTVRVGPGDEKQSAAASNNLHGTAAQITAGIPALAPGCFCNGAFELETLLAPLELLALLRSVEDRFGRVRQTHWGDRTIDLDLVLFGAQTIVESSLIVPHPRMHFRRFVLAPIAELNPDARHPVLDMSVGQLLQRMNLDTINVILTGASTAMLALARSAAQRVARLANDALIDAGNDLGPIEWLWLGPSVIGARWRTANLLNLGVADESAWTMALATPALHSRYDSGRRGDADSVEPCGPSGSSPASDVNNTMLADMVVLPAADCASAALACSADQVRYFFESLLPVS